MTLNYPGTVLDLDMAKSIDNCDPFKVQLNAQFNNLKVNELKDGL